MASLVSSPSSYNRCKINFLYCVNKANKDDDDDDDDDDLKPQAGDKSIQMGGGEGSRCTNRATVTTLCFYLKRSLLLFLV